MTLILLFLRKHWPAIGAILVLAGVVTWTYFEGVSDGESDCTVKYERILRDRETEEAARVATAMADAAAQAKAAMEAERAHLQAQAKTDSRFGLLTNNVKGYINATPTLARCGLDANGLRYWNDANRSSAGTSTSNP